MKRFTVPCKFGEQNHPFHVYVGEPSPEHHPLHFQALWLSSIRGGAVPKEVMDSFERLHKIALENNVSFEDLCVYALGTAATEEPAGVGKKKEALPEPVPPQPNAMPDEKSKPATGLTRTIVLVYGRLENGKPFWCFVAVKPSKYAEFIERQKVGSLNLYEFAEFGEIIVSGEGDTPPEDVIAKVAEMYKTDVQTLKTHMAT